MNTEDFVTYEQAVKFKELGFDWPCYQFYWDEDLINIDPQSQVNLNINGWGRNNKSSAPTLVQAAKWLRDVKAMDIDIRTDRIGGRKYNYVVYDGESQVYARDNCNAYESALSAGIDAALELIKEKV